MTEGISLSSLDPLFPMAFTVAADGMVVAPSTRLAALYPALSRPRPFSTVFDCRRPAGIRSVADLRAADASLYLLIASDESVALKGQFVSCGESLRFVGMPWYAWMSANTPAVRLDLGDFPRFDSQLDQQFYVATQRGMVADLEALNDELRQLQAAEQESSRMRSEFFAMMSHEMRTPLNGVVSALRLLENPDRQCEHGRLVRVASNAANHLMTVINYALDYSKIDANAMEVRSTAFNVRELVHGVASIVQGRAEEKGIRLGVDVDGGTPSMLEGDDEKLRQILTNLVGNAVKFTERGHVELRVRTTKGRGVEFVVEDTGCGIPRESLEQIFEPYWTRQRSASGELGTGLGLNICERLVELMEGRIDVRSEVGEGTRFSVWLPLSTAIDETGAGGPAVSGPTRFRGHVLLVDDNETNRMLQGLILEGKGIRVTTAPDGPAAIEAAANTPFDLVLMDISMPGMDGVEAMQHIKALPLGVPVVAVTAHVGADIESEYLAAGFDGYLQKPLEEPALSHELAQFLPEREAEPTFDDRPLVAGDTLEKMLSQVGAAGFDQVRALFLRESERRLGTLLGAWVRRDLNALALESHALAGSVAAFGGKQLHARLKQLETASREGNLPAVIAGMKEIENAAKSTFAAIEGARPGESRAA